MFTYLCTPITDVKCLEFPAIRFVKMNSNLVLFDLVRMCSASVTPRSCWKDWKHSCNKLMLHSAIRSSENVYWGGRYRHFSRTLGWHVTTKFSFQESCLEVTRCISGQFHIKLPEEHKARTNRWKRICKNERKTDRKRKKNKHTNKQRCVIPRTVNTIHFTG
jgi:hypothetical protein